MTARIQPSRLRILYRGRTTGSRTRTPYWSIDAETGSVMFATMDPYIASQYEPEIQRLELSGEAKVLFEGTKQFAAFDNKARNRIEHIVNTASKRGYDAVWFADQKIGVAIMSPDHIVSEKWITVPSSEK